MKLRYKISILVVFALAVLSPLGRKRLALAGRDMRRVLIRLLLTIALAIAVYILTYALIIGGILWLLIS